MDSVIERIQKGNFWQFHGGIHPPEQKFLTSTKPIASAQIPEQLIIPIRQHIGQAGKLIVNVGDKVLKGQMLSSADNPMSLPIHAPTSGTVSAIQSMAIPHPSGLSETCLILTPDGEDTWKKRHICPDYEKLPKDAILEKIANAGISGMGGAGFPTQVKVSTLAKIEYLIINAAECEPYITADDLLIQEHSPTILDGIKILDHVLAPKHILIGIEDNKPVAIEVLKKVTAEFDHINICVIPTKYPSGGEKQLIQILTGQEVPSGVLPSSLGIVMQNVATCFAIAEAVISDTPLIKRVVTVSGQALEKPQNVWALIGTPVGYLTQQCGYTNSQDKHLIMGGPMMGFSLPNDQVPVIKTTNCILAPSEIEIASPFSSTSSKEVECIRCGQCADACPAQLLPQELQWSAKAKDQPQLEKLNLFDCIECGACAYVCPSQIPLVHYYRVAKAEIRQQKLLDIKAEKAKVRFEARKLRLEREKIARAEKHKKAAEARKARMNAGTPAAKSEKSAVAAALARVKAKKAQNNTNNEVTNAQTASTTTNDSVEQVNDSKSQVANAIARAKAKKLAQQNQVKLESIDTAQDIALDKASATPHIEAEKLHDTKIEPTAIAKDGDKNTKVAAAVAKAKAKAKAKAQAKKQQPVDTATTTMSADDSKPAQPSEKLATADKITSPNDAIKPADDKKAKVAAAVAKAKAKAKAKAQAKKQQPADTATTTMTADDSKPAQPSEKLATADKITTPNDAIKPADDKKTKVAAAVAKAKAKAKAKAQAKKRQADANHSTNKPLTAEVVAVEANDITQVESVDNQQSSSANNNADDNSTKQTPSPALEVEHTPAKTVAKAEQIIEKNDESLAAERKAKIASAIAKAKAKKLAETSQSVSEAAPAIAAEQDETKNTATIDEHKKARIAATIAKAKAKKLAASSKKSQPSE